MSGRKNKSRHSWKREIKESQNYKCLMCEKQFSNRGLQIHHIVNKCRNGKSTKENCIALCEKCHKWIHETYGNNTYDPRK
jgi:5-methylcytosine-specific restriction endonuclease McrA